MGLQLSSNDQVLALAPDSSSAAAGKKLANASHWQSLGQSPEALWGECQGSALYQVRIDLSTLTITCTCPSRKLPCKHGLGLLLLTVDTPATVPTSDPPEWVSVWLTKRGAASKRKETKETQKTPDAPPSAAQAKNTAKRAAQMTKGIERLDLWLNDLIRSGLASVETQPARFWEDEAAQMVDAQVPGLGVRLRRMAAIPNSSPHWPARLLAELGKLALLTHSFRQGEQADTSLQADIRQLVGWSIKQEEVFARGETVADEWLILGQRVNDEEKTREQWTWMRGRQTGRSALILQFAFGQTPFAEVFPLGARQAADLTFWPSAFPLRARLEARHGEILPLQDCLPGAESIEDFFKQVAAILARQPWQERFLCILRDVTPLCREQGKRWYVRDSSGAALPLTKGEHWRLLAISGGQAVDFAGEWDGEALYPLGMLVDSKYYLL
jgi:SWIM zinc finger